MIKTFFSFAYILALSASLTAQIFSTPVPIESMNAAGGYCGEFTSLLMVNGKPAIAYYDYTHGDLLFMRALDAAGNSWGTPVIADAHNNVGKFCSMEIVYGYPAISYFDHSYDRLMYVRALDSNGTAWGNPVIVEDIVNQMPWYVTLKMINGNPAIAFAEVNNIDAKYIRASDNLGNSWGTSVTIASTGQVGVNLKLSVVAGNPAVVYTNQTNGAVSYCRANDASGTTWGTPILISGAGDSGWEMSCSFAAGKPAVSYYNQTNSTLKFVVANDVTGSSWQTPITLDNSASVGRYTSMCNSNGYLMISYMDMTNSRTKFIRCLDTLGTNWDTPVPVTANGIAYNAISMQIVNGNPAISFTTASSPMLLGYCHANNPSGTSWDTVQTFSVPAASGRNLSMSVVDGRPAASSSRLVAPGKVAYAIAADSTGQNWNSSINAVNPVSMNCYTSMKIVNGSPAIAYTSNGSDRVNYVRSLDSAGTSWSTPTRVDSTAFAPQHCELLNANGKPAIGYYDNNAQRIYFTCASNTNGTSWMPAVLPAGALAVSPYFDIEMVHGKPAITFVNYAGTAVYYSIAQDSLGQTWSPRILIDTGSGPFQSRVALNVVAGNPAVMYGDPLPFTLGYRRANDPYGNTWGPLIETSSTAAAGFEAILMIHDGRPVAAFQGAFNEQYFIAANDSLGNSWSQEVFIDSAYSLVFGTSSAMISCNGYVGVAHSRLSDYYAYFSSACIPPLNPNVTGSSITCSGNSVQLSASGYGTISWYTSATGGTYLGSGNTFNTGALSSTTTIYVQDSTCGASTRTPKTIFVNPSPTLTLSGNTTICQGDTTTLTASGSGNSYLWSTGNTTTTETFSPAATIPVTVTSSDAATGCSSTLSFTITVTPPATTSQSVTICANDFFQVGSSIYTTAGTYTDSLSSTFGCDSVVITNLSIQPLIDTSIIYSSGVLTSAESGATYQWIKCQTMLPISGATSQSFTPLANATYAVIITNGPCIDTSTCYNVTDVGIAQSTGVEITMQSSYSPGTNQINGAVTGTNSRVEITVYNSSGQLIDELKIEGGQTFSVPVSASGIYLVKASADGHEIVQRVVVNE